MSRRRVVLRLSGILLISLALLLGLYTLVAYFGWQSGQRIRAEEVAAEQRAEIGEQFELAQRDAAEGNLRLAARRLEWVVEQDPQHEAAGVLLEQIRTALNGPAENTPEAPPSPSPAVSAPATSTVPAGTGEENRPEQTLPQLRKLVNDEEWDEAIPELLGFQRRYPEYERRETDELLFEAYIRYGEELLYTDQIELGLFYLQQAEQLGNLPTEISDQRQWAMLYLDGISFYGVNWDVAIFYFRNLCAAAPFFHDACQRLEEALVAQGDLFAAQQEWCPAETLYAEAFRLNDSTSTGNKLGEARTGCAAATPTPSVPLTGTVPITGTQPITGTETMTGSQRIFP